MNGRIKYIYLHGFNSNSLGQTSLSLREKYKDEILFVDYDYINPNIAYEQINSFLLDCFMNKDYPILIGTSLGGFWANVFSNTFNLKSILVNPCYKPSFYLKKHLGLNKNYITGEVKELNEENLNSYSLYEKLFYTNSLIEKIVILGKKDKLIPYLENEKIFKDISKCVILDDLEHQIKDIRILEKYINEIESSYTTDII